MNTLTEMKTEMPFIYLMTRLSNNTYLDMHIYIKLDLLDH